MNKEEFLSFIATDEGKAIMGETGFTTLNKEVVESYLTGTDDGKAILFSQNDKAWNRRFEKFKNEGQLDKLVEEAYQKKHPNLTPEQIELREAKLELETLKRNATKVENIKALKAENEQYGLTEDILDLIINDDFESSKEQLNKIGSNFKKSIDKIIEDRVAEALKGTRKPIGGEPTKAVITYNEYLAMSPAERAKVPTEQLKQIMNS